MLLDVLKDLETVPAGERNVQHDQVRGGLPHQAQGGFPVGGGEHLEILVLEEPRQGLEDLRFVVN